MGGAPIGRILDPTIVFIDPTEDNRSPAVVASNTTKSWGKFSVEGSHVTVNASTNVRQILRPGDGSFEVSFNQPMPLAKYALTITLMGGFVVDSVSEQTTGGFAFKLTRIKGASKELDFVSFAVYAYLLDLGDMQPAHQIEKQPKGDRKNITSPYVHQLADRPAPPESARVIDCVLSSNPHQRQ